MASRKAPPPPVAIIGMALRLPGGVTTPEEFWNLMIEKRDGRCRVPVDRYNVDAFYDAKLKRQAVPTEHGYFLKDLNLRAYDASSFPSNRNELPRMDPQIRLLFEVVWECMESAGQTKLRGTNAGVFVGAFGEDWHDLLHRDQQSPGIYRITSSGDFILSNRVSGMYDLRGPSMTIRTACSASMSALHLACQALYNGDCPVALVAGTNLIVSPTMTMDIAEQGALSPTGSCKTFDANADGYARGEAVNAILIKPLEDALRDGDPIRAVIRSTSANSDGSTTTHGVPSQICQEALIRRSYEAAGIADFSQTAFVECHGTGTLAGDPPEVKAVGSIFGECGVYIGSVKPNVGHSEGASGITSIIKAVLALEHQVIPPNINFVTPNPKLPFEECKLTVPLEPTPWPKDRHERVSVNCFGIGGSNAHAILDSAASFGIVQSVEAKRSRSTSAVTNGHASHFNGLPNRTLNGSGTPAKPWLRLLPISANNEKSLQARVDDLKRHIEPRWNSLDSVAHTLGFHRIHLPHRTFCVASGDDETLDFGSLQKTSARSPDVVFVFTGQGGHWAGMGRALINTSEPFREDIQKLDQVLQSLDKAPEWTIQEVLCSEDASRKLAKAEFAQPLCTAVQLALTNLLAKCGIRPSAVVGHSSGEIAAAYAAGALTMSEAILCSYLRGFMMKHQKQVGAMAAVGLSRAAVSPYLVDGVCVACENSPKSVTLSGNVDALEKTLEAIDDKGDEVFIRRLRVNVAYHSHHMQAVGGEYEAILKSHISDKEAAVPFYSTVSGRLLKTKTQLGPKYWRNNLESPVLFFGAMNALLKETKNDVTFVEVGPHAALQGPINQILKERTSKRTHSYVPTLIRNKDCAKSTLIALGELFSRGHPVDFSYINPTAPLLTDLPNYPWDHSIEYWSESRLASEWRFRKHAYHELLGSSIQETSSSEPAWRNVLTLYNVSWLTDHKLVNDVVFPCTGYVAMMGEAIRQVCGSEAYMLQNLMVKSALVLPETDSVEIITTMRSSRLTDLSKSSWYDLVISTFNGSTWVENCSAQGKAADIRDAPEMPVPTPHVRRISSEFLYERMSSIGLRYGPRFQGLSEVTAHTDEFKAVAAIIDDESMHLSRYTIHPTTMDFCLQLFLVARTRGITRSLDSLHVPFSIKSIEIHPGGSDLIVEASVRFDAATGRDWGDAVAVTRENKRVIKIGDALGLPLDTGIAGDKNHLLHAARLSWHPDIDFLQADSLIRRTNSKRGCKVALERLATLCILQMLDTLQSLNIMTSGYLAKFVGWLEDEKRSMLVGERDYIVPEAKQWASFATDIRGHLYDIASNEVHSFGDRNASGMAKLLCRIAQPDNIQKIFQENMNPVDLLTEGSELERFYSFAQSIVNADDFFHLTAHAQPSLKVLEIGAGTGSTTESVLPSLMSKQGLRMYSEYMFTDISSGFLYQAQDKFKEWEGIQFKVLDIERDPAEQGFELGSYDLVIASNVLHATSSLQQTLRNARSLLRPGGRLFLQELVHPFTWNSVAFITGLLPGWWIGENDDRVNSPLVSIERWNKELVDAGFSDANSVVLDDEMPLQINAIVVSRAVGPVSHAKAVTLLYKDEKHQFALDLAISLEKGGTKVHWSEINNLEPIQGQDVISIIELEAPFLHQMPEDNYKAFISCLSSVNDGILWLTRSAQMNCTDPRYGVILGLARTIRQELSMEFSTAEIETLDSAAVSAVASLCQKFHNRPPQEETRSIDHEFVIRDGTVHIGRYDWFPMSSELEMKLGRDDPKQLMIGQTGSFDSIHWVHHERPTVRVNEIEVDIRCVGLNFRDIMVAAGFVPGKKNCFGLEASGVVIGVGSSVDKLKAGDHVLMLDEGLFTTRKVIPASSAIKIPKGLSFQEAAAMPVVYMTAIQAIINLGNLRNGQTILIHAACGGVGQAAIHLAKMVGAKIFATVGNEEKVQYLIDHHGIPRERIFNSRTTAFFDDIMKATDNRGVDLVLNSLSGELLHASWKCVSKYGKMMEIGKRDILEGGHLGLDLFNGNRAFFGIDLDGLGRDRPDDIRRLMEQFVQYCEDGYAKPIRPVTTYPAHQALDAFRYMKMGQHIGKIVITMPEDARELLAVKAPESTVLSEVSTYLLVGGLGGLGKAVTRWMIECGARNFVFLSRSAGKTDEDQAFLREIESQGCRAVTVPGSVNEMMDVKRAIEMAPTKIAGIMQMSMVLRDRGIFDITYEEWTAVEAPKVTGTWNLHQAFLEANLDFFILFSSLSGSWGRPGQANYAAANTFLDSFAQYRQGLGLACSVINVGVMEGIGFVSKNSAVQLQYHQAGVYFLQEHHLIESIQASIKRSRPCLSTRQGECGGRREPFTTMSQLAIGLRCSKPLYDASNHTPFRGDIRLAIYKQLETQGKQATDAQDALLQEKVAAIQANPDILNEPETLEVLTWEIGRTLCRFMLVPEESLDVSMTLASMGVDSIVSIEIRNWWKQKLGFEATILQIMGAETIEGLGKLALDLLKKKYIFQTGVEAGGGGGGGSSGGDETGAGLGEV